MIARVAGLTGAILMLCCSEAQAAPTVNWSSASVTAGSRVTVQASGFGRTKKGWVRLGKEKRVAIRTDATGGFVATLRVPRKAAPGPLQAVVVVRKRRIAVPLQVVPRGRRPDASISASTTGARLWMSPTSGSQFSTVWLAGIRYRPGARVDVRVEPWRLSTVRPTGRSFVTSVDMPRGLPGPRSIQVSSGGTRFTIPYRVKPPGPVSA